MYGSGVPGSKNRGASSSTQIGATGRYDSRRLIRLRVSFISEEVGAAMMLRFPRARGPSSAWPFSTITGCCDSWMSRANSFRLKSHDDQSVDAQAVSRIEGPLKTSQSIDSYPCLATSSQQKARPASLGNGGIHSSSRWQERRIALFHLMFSAHPPA